MCGVFGIYGHPEAANLTYLGLHALQHRGQEAAGIVTTEGKVLYSHRGEGLVHELFNEAALARLPGHAAIGHTRYSTAGGGGLRNTQPFAFEYALGALAVAHNGNLTNAQELRAELEQKGAIFQSSSDTETLVHLIAHSPQRKVEDRIVDALLRVEGAYSLVFLTPDRLVAVRDPAGVRPLCVGRLRTPEQAYVVASEPTCFDLINASFERYLAPGEVFTVDAKGARSSFPLPARKPALCVFEYVYFARPDSMLGSASVYEVRKELGRRLAVEHPAEADLVLPVPDSGVPAALGYAEQMKLPFELGLIRSHYVGRTFIEPRQSIRHFGVRLKLNPVGDVLRGKRVVVVDDSIVRGTTSRKIVKMLRDAGAREVHVRISSPPTQWPCFYGIDTPTRGELIASTHTVAETVRYLTADSLGYLSREGLSQAVSAVSTPLSGGQVGLCDACFSGNYPIPIAATATPHRQLPLLQV